MRLPGLYEYGAVVADVALIEVIVEGRRRDLYVRLKTVFEGSRTAP
jgi:hypothetical protein